MLGPAASIGIVPRSALGLSSPEPGVRTAAVASDSAQKRRGDGAEPRGRECEDSLLERVVAAEERQLSSLVRDLQADGLMGQGQFLHVTMTGNGMIQSRTTDRGKRFMKL